MLRILCSTITLIMQPIRSNVKGHFVEFCYVELLWHCVVKRLFDIPENFQKLVGSSVNSLIAVSNIYGSCMYIATLFHAEY